MKEVFEKIKERLEEERDNASLERASWKNQQGVLHNRADARNGAFIDALSIVSEVEAEYINKSSEHINKSGDCSTNWIPCSERLPENDDDVLVYYQYKIMQGVNVVGWKETLGVGYYYSPSNDWIFYGGFGLDRHAIAWMPLPSPYKPTTD